MLAFRQVIADAPGQIYVSALIFSPLQSDVRGAFEEMAPPWIKLSPQPHQSWNHCLQTLECNYSIGLVQFSSDSQLLASACGFRYARPLDLWDPRTGACCSYLKQSAYEVKIEIPSPDSRLIASVTNENVFGIWDMQKHEYRFALEWNSGTIEQVVFSRDGQLIALRSVGGIIKVVCTQEGTVFLSLKDCVDKSLNEFYFSLAFSPDCKWLICNIEKGKMGLWFVQTGKQHSILEDKLSVAFSHDSKLLALGSISGVIRLWDVSANAYRPDLKGHSGSVRTLKFSPDDQLLVSGSYDGTVRLWNIQTGKCHTTLEGHTMAFSPEGNLLALGTHIGLVRLWNISKDDYESTFQGHTGSVTAICFSPDGRILASGSYDTTIRLWDLQPRALLPKLKSQSHTGEVIKVTYSPNKQLVASSQYNKTILWNATTGDSCYALDGGDVSFSTDSQLMLSISWDCVVRLLDVQNWNCRAFSKGTLSAFSPDCQLVASVSVDHSIHLWHVQTGDEVIVFHGHSMAVVELVFSPINNLLASGSRDGTARLWNLQTGECSHILKDYSWYPGIIVFAPNGKFLASKCQVRGLRVWDTHTGCRRLILGPHIVGIHTVVFSPDSHFMAAGSSDQMVRLWGTQTGEHLLKIPYLSHRPRIEFRAGIELLFVDGMAHRIRSTNVSEAEIAESSRDVSDLQVDRSGQWVMRSSERLLWLPWEQRASDYAVCGNQIVIGSDNGRVTFLSFEDNPSQPGRKRRLLQ